MKKKILYIAMVTTLILGLVTLSGCGSSKQDIKEKKKISSWSNARTSCRNFKKS